MLAGGVPMVIAALAIGVAARAVVSERHLQGVKALTCELETSESEFTLTVNTKERTLTLAGAETKLPYTDVSESVLRFWLKLPGRSPLLECDLELPAGWLNCAPPGTPAKSQEGRVVGFCVTSS
jgi:hypothetical protein